MSDPRITLAHTTLTGLKTKAYSAAGLFPRTTMSPVNEQKPIPDQGIYYYVDQDPKFEGELIIYYNKSFGVIAAEAYVGVDISGTLQWKQVTFFDVVINGLTGEEFSA